MSLDPGVRSFVALYSAEGIEGYLGNDYSKTLELTCSRINHLKSLISTRTRIDNQGTVTSLSRRTIHNMKKCVLRLNRKISNKIRDLHYKIINFLCLNFKTIILPTFQVKHMTSVDNRSISKTVVRRMLELSHGKFRDRLMNYCNI